MTKRLKIILAYGLFSWLLCSSMVAAGFSTHQTDTFDGETKEFIGNAQNIVERYPGLCVGIALVTPDGTLIRELGACDRKSENGEMGQTIFRIGSVSKMLVGLAVLKLLEQNRISLDDMISDILPELEYGNPWEKEYPVRIVHLLEHTTGWDEIHITEITHNQYPPISLDSALDFRPNTRVSRWVPGTRFAYSNAGYGVAAAIVEKVSGISYEEFVASEILNPLQMKNSTFFLDELYEKNACPTFNWAMKKQPYKHELYRAASGMNSSTTDMAKILQIFLDRGRYDTIPLFLTASIERMETPKSNPGALAGLTLGYGLGNFSRGTSGFIYQGHQGAIDGGLAELAYLPEHGVGHVVLLNANNAAAMQELLNLVRHFEQAGLTASTYSSEKYKGPIKIEEGYYLAINPRNQNRFYQDVFLNIEKVNVYEDYVTKTWIFPSPVEKFIPISETAFSSEFSNRVSLVLADDPLVGRALYTDRLVLMPISEIRVLVQFFLFGAWLILMLFGIAMVLVLFVAQIISKKNFQKELQVCALPVVATLSVVCFFSMQYTGLENTDLMLSHPTPLSIGLAVCSMTFLIAALASLLASWKFKSKRVRWYIYLPMLLLGFLHLCVAIYLVYFGMIPLVTWI